MGDLSPFRESMKAVFAMMNSSSLQFYVLIWMKLNIKPIWIAKNCPRKAIMVLKFQRNCSRKGRVCVNVLEKKLNKCLLK